MMTNLPANISIRHPNPEDHKRIISVMKDWWHGRDLSHMVPRLFLEHFSGTSFILENNKELIGFLIGFLSPDKKGEGYIHFSGVNPEHRHQGLGRYLYHSFEKLCLENDCRIIRSCTSPVNKTSILFHSKTGFKIEEGDSVLDGIPVTLDYNRPDDPKVLFKKTIP